MRCNRMPPRDARPPSQAPGRRQPSPSTAAGYAMRDLTVWTLTLRLVVAAAAGLVLGIERELRAHAAGLRTHTLVALGAALFTVAGAYGFADLPRRPTVDPARRP